MLDYIFSLISPHYCLSCGKVGPGLCKCCIRNIPKSVINYCVICNSNLIGNTCKSDCKLRGVSQYIILRREGVVKKLINDIKFNYAREHILVLAKILSSIQYKFDNDLVVVPIPTSSSHVRQRGFDHTKILAKKFAKIRKLNYSTTLGRNHNHQQIGSSRKARSIQAKTAFYYKSKLPLDSQIMLLDDVVTTGSTVLAAVDCLQQAGHQNISILAVAHQPLE